MATRSPQACASWRRIVVKVGTSTLTAGSGRLNPPRMVELARQIATLRGMGKEVVLVTSGAQQAGRERLGNLQDRRNKSIPYKQMLAAVGQGRLMRLWEQYFELYDLAVAQVLLTREDVEDRHRYLNLRDTFGALLQRGIVPIVNENDAVATDEIKVGENDSLSAMVANLIEADLLVLLTDQDGLYTSDPTVDPNARLIECVQQIDTSIYELAGGSKSGLGTGGMYTKILAAEIAMRSGTSVAITNGSRENVLPGLCAHTVASLSGATTPVATTDVAATWFPAAITPAEGRKRWLLTHTATAGTVTIDAGAARAISSGGCSLLPVGIVRAEGEFGRGTIIRIQDPAGHELARGICNYSAGDLRRILGQHSGDIAEILGYDYGPEFIHRDNLVVL